MKMGSLFSKKEKSKVTDQDRAVLQLKSTRDRIRQYQKRAEATLEKDRVIAKELLQKQKKDRAKLLLRKKRFIEEQLRKTDGQLENVEKMIQDIEYAQIEMKVVDSLKVGNEALKTINEVLNIADVEKILDETQDAVEKQREIDALLSGTLTREDEEAVEDELESLLSEALERQLPEAPTAADNPEVFLPEVPEEKPVSEKENKERIAVEAV